MSELDAARAAGHVLDGDPGSVFQRATEDGRQKPEWAPRDGCLAHHRVCGGGFVMLRWIFGSPPTPPRLTAPLNPSTPHPGGPMRGVSSVDIHSRRERNNTELQSPAGYFGSSFSSCGHTATFRGAAWPPDDGGKGRKPLL